MRVTGRSIVNFLRGGHRLDAARENTARAFHLLLIAVLLWSALILAVDVPFFAVRKLAVLLVLVAVSATASISLYLLRAGRFRAAAAVFVSVVWVFAAAYAELSGGLSNPTYVLLPLMILNAAWLLGRSGVIGSAAATLFLSAAELVLRSFGYAPPHYFPGNPISTWFVFFGVLIFAVSPTLLILREQHRQVLALRDSEERFRSLSDSALEGIMIHDKGVILDANLAFARMFGYECPEDFIGRNGPDMLLTAESRARILERMERHETGVVEVTCVRRDGTTFPAETESRPMKHHGRDARLAVVRDITERKRAMEAQRESEEKLRENQRRLEEAQQMAHLGNYTVDGLTGQMEWSAEMCRIYEFDPSVSGPSREEALARVHPDDRAFIRRIVVDARSRRGRFDFEHRLLMPDGRIKYVMVTGEVGPGADGRLQTRGTVQDITALRHAEQEKAKLEDQLHQAHKMESIGRLAGGIAHDFNNLLTVINGFSKLLMDEEDGQVRKYADQIHKAGESAASLTRQLLAFSRKEVTHPEPVQLNAIVAESREMLGRLVGEHIDMRASLDASPDEVMADPNQMQQCLMNLVLNARDAMPSGGQLTIETSNVRIEKDGIPSGCSGAPGQYVRLTVRDTGVGMDEETRQRIFEPFFTTKEKGSGIGLGLSTVYGVVNQWHGFLSARSERGRGSEFSIHLPLSLSISRPETAPAGKIATPGAAIRKTVLVVEDQEIVRGFVVETLRRSGHSVLEAQSGAEALEIIGQRGSEIDLLVTDVRMPGMRGKELARQAHAAYPSIRVLFMTGYADESINSINVPAGTDEVIMKPFTPESLNARVRGLLRPDEDSVVSAESPASRTAQ